MREINKLKWDDEREDYLTLWTRKSRNSNLVSRNIPYNKILKEVIKGLPKESEFVFINPVTKTRYDHRDKLLGTLCRKAGVAYYSYRCFRHFSASQLATAGAGIGDIQGILVSRAVTSYLTIAGLLAPDCVAAPRLRPR